MRVALLTGLACVLLGVAAWGAYEADLVPVDDASEVDVRPVTSSPSPSPTPTATAFSVPSAPPPAPVTAACPPAPPRPQVVDPAGLSVAEQAGIVLATGIPGATSADHPEARAAADLGVGAVVLKRANVTSTEQARALVEELAAASPYGLLFLVDHEGGRVQHADAVVPSTASARRLGQAGPEAARETATTIGTALRGAGIHVDLAPVADLDDGPYDGIIGDRSFGADPAVVGPAAVAFLEGLRSRGTLGVAKHFPGYAGAADTHFDGATVDVDRTTLQEVHLQPFRDLVGAGVGAVMLGHVDYAAFDGPLPASMDPEVYDLLRAQGFDGVAMTDSLGMGAAQAQGGHAGAAVAAMAAGADVLLANQGSEAARAMRDALVAAVEDGDLPRARLAEAAGRVMRWRAHQAVVAAGCG